ncbi:MAG: hypothetical protein WCL27_10560, partial [Betaproteobacteria bacterium]
NGRADGRAGTEATLEIMGTSTLPPAIVWGIDAQIGLWIVRELGQHGIPVIGLAGTRASIGGRSRYLKHAELARPRGPELLAQIRALGETWGPCMILAVSEVNATRYSELARTCANLNQLAKHANEGRVVNIPPDLLLELLDHVQSLRKALLGVEE